MLHGSTARQPGRHWPALYAGVQLAQQGGCPTQPGQARAAKRACCDGVRAWFTACCTKVQPLRLLPAVSLGAASCAAAIACAPPLPLDAGPPVLAPLPAAASCASMLACCAADQPAPMPCWSEGARSVAAWPCSCRAGARALQRCRLHAGRTHAQVAAAARQYQWLQSQACRCCTACAAEQAHTRLGQAAVGRPASSNPAPAAAPIACYFAGQAAAVARPGQGPRRTGSDAWEGAADLRSPKEGQDHLLSAARQLCQAPGRDPALPGAWLPVGGSEGASERLLPGPLCGSAKLLHHARPGRPAWCRHRTRCCMAAYARHSRRCCPERL